MALELVTGSPLDKGNRLAKEIRCYELLDNLHLTYWRCDHEVAPTMEACKEIDKILEAQICRNLFLCNRQKTEFYLLMIPEDKPFKTRELQPQIGCSRLSFADAIDMERLLDITPGSVSVLGLMNDHDNKVQLLVDEELLNSEYIGCHPCINTSSLKLYTKDVFGPVLEAMHHKMITVRLVGE